MNLETYWSLTDPSMPIITGYEKLHKTQISNRLRQLDPDSLKEFFRLQNLLAHTISKQKFYPYTTILSNGWCGDDTYMDFTEWLVCQGKATYLKAHEEASSLLKYFDKTKWSEWEEYGYLAPNVFEANTGECIYGSRLNSEISKLDTEEE